MTTDINAERIKMINDMKEEVVTLTLATKFLPTDQYIVVCQAVPIAFTVTNNIADNARHASVLKATRFTKANAVKLAKTVTNGNNEVGEAVQVVDAVNDTIGRLNSIIKTLEEIVADTK